MFSDFTDTLENVNKIAALFVHNYVHLLSTLVCIEVCHRLQDHNDMVVRLFIKRLRVLIVDEHDDLK